MVVEVFLDPNKELPVDDPVILTQFNVSKAIRDNILVNFSECGLASLLGSFQGMWDVTSPCLFGTNFPLKLLRHFPGFLSLNIYFVCIVKYVNPITKLCIIRASREDCQKVWSAITMVRSIGNCLVLFNVLDLSGEFIQL